MDSKINNKEIVSIIIDELEKRSIIKKNFSTYKNTERLLYDYPKLKDTIVERKEQIKELNRAVTQKEFIDKDENEYIYASLSQPPIKIIDKNNSNDELDYTVECPNCHRHVNYGHEIFMVSGHLYCSSNKCRDEVYKKVGYY